MGSVLTAYEETDCPEMRHKRAGDEYYDICSLNGKHCEPDDCPYYKKYLEEIKDGR